jgi:hypothetical protein
MYLLYLTYDIYITWPFENETNFESVCVATGLPTLQVTISNTGSEYRVLGRLGPRALVEVRGGWAGVKD